MVGIKTDEIRGDRMITEVKIYSKKDMSLVAIGRQMSMAYNFADRKKTAIPESWK